MAHVLSSEPRPAASPPLDLVVEALADRRVRGALALALRDAGLRASFEALRGEGVPVAEAVERLRGPHADVDGRPYFLSEERVRSIVYRKGPADL